MLLLVLGWLQPPGTAERGQITALVGVFTELTSGGQVPTLDEIGDALETIEDAPLTDIPPLDGEGAGVGEGPVGGGAIGGGVSEGPTGEEPALETPLPTTPMPTAMPPDATATTEATATPTPATATATATPVSTANRLAEPVLQWLPELRAATAGSDVSWSLVAGLVQVESGGDPNVIARDGGRGLTGISTATLEALNVPEADWHDPAANLDAAVTALSAARANGASWDSVLRAWFGPDCDGAGRCPDTFAYAVTQWSAYYAAIMADPEHGGLQPVSAAWAPPPVAPTLETVARPIPLPPGVAPPTSTPTRTPTTTIAPTATATTISETTPTLPATTQPTVSIPTVAVPTATSVPTAPPNPEPTRSAPRR